MIRLSKDLLSTSTTGLANSYAQLFLSANPVAGILIGLASFTDPIAGLAGLLMAFFTNVIAFLFHLDKEKIKSGTFAFNGLLTGLFLGYSYNISYYLLLIIFAGSFLCLMLTVVFDGILGAKKLPFLSIPFLLSVWILKLSTEGFNSLDPNSTQIFVFNHIYRVGGENLLKSYEFLEGLPIPLIIKVYSKDKLGSRNDFMLEVTQNYVVLEEHKMRDDFLNKDAISYYSFFNKESLNSILVETSDNNQKCTKIMLSDREYPSEANNLQVEYGNQLVYENA
jgi:hypothetical protein